MVEVLEDPRVAARDAAHLTGNPPPGPRPGRLAAAAAAALLCACSTVPVTGRQQFNLLPPEQDVQLGAQAYDQMLAEAKVNDQHPSYDMVQRVAQRLIAVAEPPTDFDWEVHLIQDDATANAWALPGGKMAVYTGILPLTKDEAGLATVMAHEIGHAVARHGTERMTQQVGLQRVVDYIAGDYANLAGTAANLLVHLPWGRKQELEADHIGLIYMAKAGYDPRAAVDFWKRMADAKGGQAPPELLSTHPSDAARIAQIEELLPEALKHYQAAGGKPGQDGPKSLSPRIGESVKP